MSDISERLSKMIKYGSFNHPTDKQSIRDARDEIERLRVENNNLCARLQPNMQAADPAHI